MKKSLCMTATPEHFDRLMVFQSEAPLFRAGSRNEPVGRGAQGSDSQARESAIATSFVRKSRIQWPIPRKWSPNSGFWRLC